MVVLRRLRHRTKRSELLLPLLRTKPPDEGPRTMCSRPVLAAGRYVCEDEACRGEFQGHFLAVSAKGQPESRPKSGRL
jgi:hypothetical protein